jgi:hypothetical protein
VNEKKTKWHLLYFPFLKDLVEIFREGSTRPGRYEQSWQDLPTDEKTEEALFNACLRHLVAARESKSPKQARSHFASVAANAMMMSYHAEWRINNETSNTNRTSDICICHECGASNYTGPRGYSVSGTEDAEPSLETEYSELAADAKVYRDLR